MSNYKILVEENGPDVESVSQEAGLRHDVYVKIEDDYFNLTVCTPDGLKRDFDEGMEMDGAYVPGANMVFVEDLTNAKIHRLVSILVQQYYFAAIQAEELDEDEIDALVELGR